MVVDLNDYDVPYFPDPDEPHLVEFAGGPRCGEQWWIRGLPMVLYVNACKCVSMDEAGTMIKPKFSVHVYRRREVEFNRFVYRYEGERG